MAGKKGMVQLGGGIGTQRECVGDGIQSMVEPKCQVKPWGSSLGTRERSRGWGCPRMEECRPSAGSR